MRVQEISRKDVHNMKGGAGGSRGSRGAWGGTAKTRKIQKNVPELYG